MHFPQKTRSHCAQSLGKIKDRRAVEPLIQKLNDESIVWYVAEALGKIGDSRAVEPLMNVLISRRNNEVNGMVVWALGELKSPMPLNMLLEINDNFHPTNESEELDKLYLIEAINKLKEISTHPK